MTKDPSGMRKAHAKGERQSPRSGNPNGRASCLLSGNPPAALVSPPKGAGSLRTEDSVKRVKDVTLYQLFKTRTPIIGVVHLLPLPTSPRWGGSLKAVIDRAEQEATALASGGVDGIIVENFFDAPFPKNQVDPAVVSAMTVVVQRIQNLVTLPVGINVLRNDGRSAIAIATCTKAQFIRVNVLTGVMATDQGIIEGEAHQLLRYRRELGSDVKIFADVLVKHARPLSAVNLTTAVQDTIERGLADAVIMSGWATGDPPNLQDLEMATSAAHGTPVFIGSGASWENIGTLLVAADGVIVSSALKRHGRREQPIDPNRVSQFVEAARKGWNSKEETQSIPSVKLHS